jgi:DNA segregation ATPase FtsK/SpoIIIE, S-DNA-T family
MPTTLPGATADPLGLTTNTGRVPVGPTLSMFDPLFIGIDEFGAPVTLDLVFRNILAGGEPGGGKSGLLNLIAGHAALAANTRLVLFDAKQVELGLWADVADEFVGPDIERALSVLRRLQVVMDNRYNWLTARKRRKIAAADRMTIIVIILDEIAYFSATVGTTKQQEEFTALLRDLVARGRACGMPVVAATQRPSYDIIEPSLRDLFGYRAAFRCTTLNSSNIVLGQGWAEQGYTATDILPTNHGECLLLAEGGIPKRVKVAYLTDAHIIALADHAAWIRRPNGLTVPAAARTNRIAVA